MKVLSNFISFILLLMVLGCKEKEDSLRCIFKSEPIPLKSKIITIDSVLIGNPLEIEVFDSLLVLRDEYKNKYFSLIDIKNKKLVKRFGKKGKGPNEILRPFCIKTNPEHTTLQLYTRTPKRIMEYSWRDVIDNPKPIPREKVKFNIQKGTYFYVSPMTYMDKFIGTGLFPNGKYGVCNKLGKLDTVFGEVTRSKEQTNIESYKIGMGYQGAIKCHPDSNQYVYLCSSCDLIETIKFKKNKPSIKRLQTYFPKFDMREGSAVGIILNSDSPYGFVSSDVTSKYIYALYSGKTYNDKGPLFLKGNLLYVFNWDLHPVCSYILDHDLTCIAVSEDDKELYSVALNDEMNVVKWNLIH